MRKIKFRGRGKGGNLHYGFYYVDFCGNTCIAEGRGGTLIIVDEDSVAQLVGVDSAGNEVYEGDYVYVRTNSGGTTFKPATMIDIHLVNNYTLKGGDDNGGA